jgi:hypothetical protein
MSRALFTPPTSHRTPILPTRERDFVSTLLDMAKVAGWKHVHFRPARSAKGWRTALEGEPGWPDVNLARQGETILAECKVGAKRPTVAQWEWLVVLATNQALEVYVWYPRHWDAIEARLVRREGCGPCQMTRQRFSRTDPREALVCGTCGRVRHP